MNKRKAVCIERCTYSLVGGRWNRAVHVPRQRPTQLANRRRRADWLPPSLESCVSNVLTWVERLRRSGPLRAISLELAKFDTQALQNPEIAGSAYQQGTLAGYEIRAYLLEKWDRRCAYWGAQDVPLQVEHLVPRARGGSDRIANLTLACQCCNQAKGASDVGDFLKQSPTVLARILAQATTPLMNAAAVNATRWTLYRRLIETGLPVEVGTGGRTHWNRRQRGLPKAHWVDAACCGASTPAVLHITGVRPLLIRATGHGSRQYCRMNKHGFVRTRAKAVRTVQGFRTGDLVRAKVTSGKKPGIYEGRVAVRTSGSFNITTATGTVQGISHRCCTLLHRNDGYTYFSKEERRSSQSPEGDGFPRRVF